MLGCPFVGLERLLPSLAEKSGRTYLGDLQLTAADSAGELRALLQRSQDAPPPDLIAAIRRYYPTPGDDTERLLRFLDLRSGWSTRQLLDDLLQRIAPVKAVLLETVNCLRIHTLERWLDLGIPVQVLHVVETPEDFIAAAQPALEGRLFVAPDYRSHEGPYPRMEPLLAWLRIHQNIEQMCAALPASGWSRITLGALCGPRLHANGELARHQPERWPAEVRELAAQYGF